MSPERHRPSIRWPVRTTSSRSPTRSKQARAPYLDKIDAMGGMLKAIERGYVQQEIQNAAYEYQQAVDHGEAVVVGVNRFESRKRRRSRIQRIDESLERKQVERLKALRAEARS